MNQPACWCGKEELEEWSADYRRCPSCGTLVAREIPEGVRGAVTDEAAHYYGHDYWFGHQERDLGLPNLRERARLDLPQRCVHWMRALVRWRPPPARVLEVGSAHGGFVALLRLAGYEATGLELSPAIAAMSSEMFGVPVLAGPLETQKLEASPFDVVALFDVLEHVPEPLPMLRECVKLLRGGGLLLIQTPEYPEGAGAGDLERQDHAFRRMLIPGEHIHLFTRNSVKQILEQAGAPYVHFEKAIFENQDMFLAAGPSRTEPRDMADAEETLTRTPGGRVALALLDLSRTLDECEADRLARGAQIETLTRWVEEGQATERQLNAAAAALGEELGASRAQCEAQRAECEVQRAQCEAQKAECEAAIRKHEEDRREIERQLNAAAAALREELEAARAQFEAIRTQHEAAIRGYEEESPLAFAQRKLSRIIGKG